MNRLDFNNKMLELDGNLEAYKCVIENKRKLYIKQYMLDCYNLKIGDNIAHTGKNHGFVDEFKIKDFEIDNEHGDIVIIAYWLNENREIENKYSTHKFYENNDFVDIDKIEEDD